MTKRVYFVISCGLAICTVLLDSSFGLEKKGSRTSSMESNEDSSSGFLWKMFSKGRDLLNNFNLRPRNSFTSSDPHRIINGQRLDGSLDEVYDDPQQPEHREVLEYKEHENYKPYDSNYMNHQYATKVVYRGDNMELYSLLGGLSFASLLATTLIILTRRNGTLFRSSDAATIFRNNPDSLGTSQASTEPYEVRLKIPKALVNMGKLLWRRPWWSSEGRRSSRGMNTYSS